MDESLPRLYAVVAYRLHRGRGGIRERAASRLKISRGAGLAAGYNRALGSPGGRTAWEYTRRALKLAKFSGGALRWEGVQACLCVCVGSGGGGGGVACCAAQRVQPGGVVSAVEHPSTEQVLLSVPVSAGM